MQQFSDAAIFHRWMSLAWTLRDPEFNAILTAEEKGLVNEFHSIYDSIQWRPIGMHPFISDAATSDLEGFNPIAARLLTLFEMRTLHSPQS